MKLFGLEKKKGEPQQQNSFAVIIIFSIPRLAVKTIHFEIPPEPEQIISMSRTALLSHWTQLMAPDACFLSALSHCVEHL